MTLTPKRRLLALKLSILVLAIVAIATGSAALIIHSINGMFTATNEFTNCTGMPSQKLANISTLLLVTSATMITGIFFGTCLAVLMIGWLLRREPNETIAAMKFRVPTYLLAAISLLAMSLAFGYYLSFVLDDMRVGCQSVYNVNLPQIILLGSSTIFMLMCLILCLALPKVLSESPYNDNRQTEF